MTPTPMDMVNSASTLVSLMTEEKFRETAKSIVIVLIFGGGLIPATISANQAMMKTLSGVKNDSSKDDPATSFDPTAGTAVTYIADSGASGPELPNSALILANEKIPLVDMIAIVGRITDINSIADWRNLPSALMEGAVDPENPPMWLPRATFKANIRKAKFGSWPNDPETGLPVGGEDLKKAELARVKKPNVLIGDAALDAVFDTWGWGASIGTPDKVQVQLNDWRPNAGVLDVGRLANAATRGKAVTVVGALTFVIIQVVAYGTLFIAPALRAFFDIDLGFGTMGECSANGCYELFG